MKNNRGLTVVEVITCITIIASLVFGFFVGYVGWHFVAKFW